MKSEELENKEKVCPSCGDKAGEVKSCPYITKIDSTNANKFPCGCCELCRNKCEERLP